MGWWQTDETGKSFVPKSKLTWGDIPADRMNEIMDEFASCLRRYPTLEEVVAGYRFSIGGREKDKRMLKMKTIKARAVAKAKVIRGKK